MSLPPPPLPQDVPPPLPTQVLQYAAPMTATPAQFIWREGNKLITMRQGALPQRCVKCNADADGFYKNRKFYWYPPLAILFGALIALLFRKEANVRVGLCKHHHRRRIKSLLLTWLFVLGGLSVAIVGSVIGADEDLDRLVGLSVLFGLIMIIAAIVAGVKSRVLAPTKMDDQYVWFKGCGPEFLSQFPSAR